MVESNEKQIRTNDKNMLVCTAKPDKDGNMKIITRMGKKEDSMSVGSFLNQVYGRPVTIMLG